MRAIHLRLPAAAAPSSLILAGCGLTDPYTSQHPATTSTSTSTSTTSTTATVDQRRPCPGARRHDPEGRPSSPEPARGGRRQPDPAGGARALRRPRHQLDRQHRRRRPASSSPRSRVGQARAQALQAAASYGHDSTLQPSQVANTGTVVAIAPGQGSAAGQWVVVTRETTTGQGDYAGLPPTDHVTYAQVDTPTTDWLSAHGRRRADPEPRHSLASGAQRGRGRSA